MHTYVFRGFVYYHDGQTLVPVQTILTIQAPTAKIAQAIMDNYGMQSIQRDKTR